MVFAHQNTPQSRPSSCKYTFRPIHPKDGSFEHTKGRPRLQCLCTKRSRTEHTLEHIPVPKSLLCSNNSLSTRCSSSPFSHNCLVLYQVRTAIAPTLLTDSFTYCLCWAPSDRRAARTGCEEADWPWVSRRVTSSQWTPRSRFSERAARR